MPPESGVTAAFCPCSTCPEPWASAAGRSVEAVRQGLEAVPDTEYDDQGRIIGQRLGDRAHSVRRRRTGD